MDLQQEYKNEKGKNHLSFESGFFPSGNYSNEYVFWLVDKIKNLSKEKKELLIDFATTFEYEGNKFLSSQVEPIVDTYLFNESRKQ